jgi:hypothetical protein
VLIGVSSGFATVVALAIRSGRRARAAHHRQLEQRVTAVVEAYNNGSVEELSTALDTLPYEAFYQGCRACSELLDRTMLARRDLGSARWFVNEHAYTLVEAWVIVRAFGADRDRYELCADGMMAARASQWRPLNAPKLLTTEEVLGASRDREAAKAREAAARERLERLREATGERRRQRGPTP